VCVYILLLFFFFFSILAFLAFSVLLMSIMDFFYTCVCTLTVLLRCAASFVFSLDFDFSLFVGLQKGH
jgi:hypothetical protein